MQNRGAGNGNDMETDEFYSGADPQKSFVCTDHTHTRNYEQLTQNM